MKTELAAAMTLLSSIDNDESHPVNNCKHPNYESAMAAYETLKGKIEHALSAIGATDHKHPALDPDKLRIFNYSMIGHVPEGSIYVGRNSKLGDTAVMIPFRLGDTNCGSLLDVGQLYIDHLIENPAIVARIKGELKSKSLCCHCAPSPCHAEILMLIANNPNIPLQKIRDCVIEPTANSSFFKATSKEKLLIVPTASTAYISNFTGL